MFIKIIVDHARSAAMTERGLITYEMGEIYEVNDTTGIAFISRGWAEPVRLVEQEPQFETIPLGPDAPDADAANANAGIDPAPQSPPQPEPPKAEVGAETKADTNKGGRRRFRAAEKDAAKDPDKLTDADIAASDGSV